MSPKIHAVDGGRPGGPPTVACDPAASEKKDWLKCRKNRLQLNRKLDRLKFLLLIAVEDGYELSKKSLLRLSHLLLQCVDLDYDDSNLGRVPAGVQQSAQLLDQGLRRLKERHELCLTRLQQLFQFAYLAGPQLQKLSHDLQGRSLLGIRLNFRCLQLLKYFFNAQSG